MTAIDLNCDMGEGMANDAMIMPFISSANIACGFHAGDEKIMWDTIELALKHDVAIGAHISFLDRKNFGRTEQLLSLPEVYDLITQQLILFYEIADSFDAPFHHVKPHGALYNMSAKDNELANTVAKAVKDFDASLILFGLSGSRSINEAEKIGLKSASEFFADRNYDDTGHLIPRSESNALLLDANEAALRVVSVLDQGFIQTANGKQLKIKADTICIHGDNDHSAIFAKEINEYLKKAGVDIKAL